jgi:glycerol transport system ATP-binding protein
MAKISLENIGFRYPGAATDTLSGLNLEVAQGEAHALLGASGAGKTTLLNLLSGLLAPTTGALRFNDEDVSQLPGRARDVAQVFQFPVLYESLSVADNLSFPLKTRGMQRREIAARIAYICDELQISHIVDKKPQQLSLFEKQLVAVGKALVRPDVSLVLLDEPLTAVEPKIKWRLRQTLRKVQADLDVTMIYVTHDQTEALTFADKVSVLTSGGILQTGTPEEVYQAPSHEFVGHFVGSPGMNFVSSNVFGVSLGDRLGFRPEWATLDSDGPVQGVVSRVRIQGTRMGQPYGLVTLSTEHGEVSVRGALGLGDQGVGDQVLSAGAATGVRLHRYVAFSSQLKVGEGELV